MKNSSNWPTEVPIVKIKPGQEDERGAITDIIDDVSIRHVSLISFNKGAIRANHFHKLSGQYNYLLSGKVELLIRIDADGPICQSVLNPGDFAYIPPLVHHALVAIENSELIALTSLPRSEHGYENDTFRLPRPLTDLVKKN